MTQNLVNGQLVEKNQLSRRSMNFGQHWRTEGIKEFNYEVYIPISFTVKLIKPEWQEMLEDYQKHPDPDDPLEAAIKTANWPENVEDVLIGNKESLKMELLNFYADEILLRWFEDGEPEKKGYVINTIESIATVKDEIRIKGMCRASHITVKYQDV